MKFHCGILLTVLALGEVALAQSTNKIDSVLQKSLQRNGRANIMVSMKDGTQPILDKLATMSFSTRVERIQAVYDALTSHASNSQRKILNFLSNPLISNKFGFVNVHSFWITNQIAIGSANGEFVNQLTTMDEVSLIKEEIIVHLHKPTEIRQVSNDSTVIKDTAWGVQKIGAPAVWEKGCRGEGVTVVMIDTGIFPTHEEFKDVFNSLNHWAWYDGTPYASSRPYDDNGHGSHVAGTMAGYRNGVAPGIQIGAYKGLMNDGSGYSTDLMKCMQQAVCPNGYCEDTPDVVSNSWGGSGGDGYFNNVIKAWNAAGICSAFAIGNEGPSCGTAGSPGDQEGVWSVGSTNSDDLISSFSSRGPRSSSVKPDIVAPGQSILSASHTSPTGYVVMSGTSMATPHVAGAMALLKCKKKELTCTEIIELLKKATHKALPATPTCGGTPYDTFPNNMHGHGRLDVLKAYNEA